MIYKFIAEKDFTIDVMTHLYTCIIRKCILQYSAITCGEAAFLSPPHISIQVLKYMKISGNSWFQNIGHSSVVNFQTLEIVKIIPMGNITD